MGKSKKTLIIPRGVIKPVKGQIKPGHDFWRDENFPPAEISDDVKFVKKKKKKKKKNKLKIA